MFSHSLNLLWCRFSGGLIARELSLTSFSFRLFYRIQLFTQRMQFRHQNHSPPLECSLKTRYPLDASTPACCNIWRLVTSNGGSFRKTKTFSSSFDVILVPKRYKENWTTFVWRNFRDIVI